LKRPPRRPGRATDTDSRPPAETRSCCRARPRTRRATIGVPGSTAFAQFRGSGVTVARGYGFISTIAADCGCFTLRQDPKRGFAGPQQAAVQHTLAAGFRHERTSSLVDDDWLFDGRRQCRRPGPPRQGDGGTVLDHRPRRQSAGIATTPMARFRHNQTWPNGLSLETRTLQSRSAGLRCGRWVIPVEANQRRGARGGRRGATSSIMFVPDKKLARTGRTKPRRWRLFTEPAPDHR